MIRIAGRYLLDKNVVPRYLDGLVRWVENDRRCDFGATELHEYRAERVDRTRVFSLNEWQRIDTINAYDAAVQISARNAFVLAKSYIDDPREDASEFFIIIFRYVIRLQS